MFQITIFFLYIIAGGLFAMNRLQRFSGGHKALLSTAYLIAVCGIVWQSKVLWSAIPVGDGLSLSIGNIVSLIGLQLVLIGLIGAIEPTLRGLAAGLLFLAALAAAQTSSALPGQVIEPMSWQIQSHVMISLFAYGLLSVGAIVAIFALVQERRLQGGKLSAVNQLFSPLETTERLLFGVTAAGFLLLLLAVSSGFALFDDLFSQHLVHKTTLSLLALVLFGILLGGRQFAGWRGKRAVYLYLWGFLILFLAYFGSRFILEEVLGRSWS